MANIDGTLTDPKCGMGYWDVAMSNYHPIWAPPTVEELKKGQAAIEKARSVGARTECEWDYIAATGYWRWSPWAPYSVWRSGSDPIWALSSSSKSDAGRRRRCR